MERVIGIEPTTFVVQRVRFQGALLASMTLDGSGERVGWITPAWPRWGLFSVRNIAEGRWISESLGGEDITIRSLELAPDGRRAITRIDHNAYLLWDLSDRTRLGSEFRHVEQKPMLFARFSPSGDHVLTGDGARRITLWHLGGASLIERACQLAGRDLSDQEWDQFLGPEYVQQPIRVSRPTQTPLVLQARER